MSHNFRGVKRVSLLLLAFCGAYVLHLAYAASTRKAPKPPKPAAPPLYTAQKLCDLKDPQIDESSGMGASRLYPGLLWTHNDSGDTARLFLIDQAGDTRAVVTLNGAIARDWEDMAVAGSGNNAWVYVGDIGDNNAEHNGITIYRFREPQLNISAAAAPQTLAVDCEQMTLHYPDGARDAESLLATTDGQLFLVSKSLGGSAVYSTPGPFTDGASQTLQLVGSIAINSDSFFGRLTTGGDISPDGTRIVVRTYTEAYEWLKPKNTSWQALWKTRPRSWELPTSQQGEAICYGLDSNSLFLTSEKLPTPLWKLTARPRK
ncbi:MAG TPA: hypothetical protein VF600_08635 [Abditibacteriaceae bacterium]|jgi:hypothetical protein